MTSSKAADRSLDRVQQVHQRIVEKATVTIFEINSSGQLVYMNPRGLRLLGYEPGELTGGRSNR